MAQLTNTRVYGTLDVDKCINVQAFTDDPDAVQITDLINRINVNSKLVGNGGKTGNVEYTPASLMFHTYSKTGMTILNSKLLTTVNAFSTRFAELSNTAGKFPVNEYNYENLFSLKLRDHTKKDTVTTRNDTLISEAHTIDDTTFDISLSVTDDFSRASSTTTTIDKANIKSTFTASTNADGKSVGITTTTVKVPLTVPSKGGEIVTDNTLDAHMRYSVNVSNTTQLTNLLNSLDFKNCTAGFAGADALGVILYAVVSHVASGTLPRYPALFYIENNAVYMACFSPSEGIFKKKSSLESGENVRIIVSTKAAYDALKKVIG